MVGHCRDTLPLRTPPRIRCGSALLGCSAVGPAGNSRELVCFAVGHSREGEEKIDLFKSNNLTVRVSNKTYACTRWSS